ncbi:MAG: hypothetical protein DLM73_05775 [Chthoniobacterales bacterium]|nr:MAG: hypothetical protein DLM73_05775 [Chthoniobacterales bacterium]
MLFHGKPPIAKNPIDFGDYLEDFDIAKFVYKDKRKAFDKLFARDPAFLADLSAAVFAILARSGYTHKDVYQKLLECCRDIIIAEGFSEIDEDEMKILLRPTADEGIPNNVLVAGCQNNEMLKRRVEKAAQFVSNLGYNCTVIFSGRNPDPSGKTTVKILDESRRMRVQFRELLRHNNNTPLPRMHDLVPEERSSTTQTNISQLFQQNLLSQTKHNNLIVISSTFHLIRLAREIKTQLVTPKHGRRIAQLLLIGAEDPQHTFYVQDAPYFKLMMFDVFEHLMRIGSTKDLKTFERRKVRNQGQSGEKKQGKRR